MEKEIGVLKKEIINKINGIEEHRVILFLNEYIKRIIEIKKED